MSPYLVAVMIPSKMTSCVAPCLDIPPHTWTLVGAYACTSTSSVSYSFGSTSAGGTQATLISKDRIMKIFLFLHPFVAPVQSLPFVCIPNCLAVFCCSVCPSEIISQPSNSSDAVLHFVCTKCLDKDFLYIRCSQLVVFCHGIVNAPVMVLWHLLW